MPRKLEEEVGELYSGASHLQTNALPDSNPFEVFRLKPFRVDEDHVELLGLWEC